MVNTDKCDRIWENPPYMIFGGGGGVNLNIKWGSNFIINNESHLSISLNLYMAAA